MKPNFFCAKPHSTLLPKVTSHLKIPSVVLAILLSGGLLQVSAEDLIQNGQITLNSPENPSVLTLQCPDYLTPAFPAPGVTISYHDSASAATVFKQFRPGARFQWQVNDTETSDHLQMELRSDNTLLLPASGQNGADITLSSASGAITIGGQPVLTTSAANATYLTRAQAATDYIPNPHGGAIAANGMWIFRPTGADGAQIWYLGSSQWDANPTIELASWSASWGNNFRYFQLGRYNGGWATGYPIILDPDCVSGVMVGNVFQSRGDSHLATAHGNVTLANGGGNVGIGTYTPSARLTVMDTIQGLQTGLTVTPYHIPYVVAGTALDAADAGGYVRPLALQANGGNVGIGTTNPAKKLHVVGDVRIEGVIRTTHAAGDLSMGGFANGPTP
jgi:hypothetical protein